MTAVAKTAAVRLPSLTGLRAVAAVLVFLNHVVALGLFANEAVSEKYTLFTDNLGTFGLSYFFVLTGFVLVWSAQPNDTPKAFWRRRFIKLYPNHIVSFLIIAVLFYISDPTLVRVPEALANLLLVQAWSPNVDFLLYSINGPSWSLNVDVLCYAAFPVLYILIRRIRENRVWMWTIIVAAAALAMPLVAHLLLPAQPESFFSPTVSWPQQWFGFYFPPTRLLEFVVGMLMARLILSGRWVKVGMVPAVLLLIAVYLATLNVSLFDGYASLCMIPIALVIGEFTRWDAQGRANAMSGRLLVWLGERSYAFFVLHISVLFTVHALFSHQFGISGFYDRHPFGTLEAIVFMVSVYALCVLLGWALYETVERPLVRRFSRPGGGRSTSRPDRPLPPPVPGSRPEPVPSNRPA